MHNRHLNRWIMKDKVIITVNIPQCGVRQDLEVPADITANELITALSKIYSLGMNPEYIFNYYLKADNPKALLRGDKTLQELGVRSGTEVWTWNS